MELKGKVGACFQTGGPFSKLQTQAKEKSAKQFNLKSLLQELQTSSKSHLDGAERKRVVVTLTSVMASPTPRYGPTTKAHISSQLPMDGSYTKYKVRAKASLS